MGAQLVAKAFVFELAHALFDPATAAPGALRPAKLKANEFRLLVHMSLTAKDTDTAPVYFGGREHCAYGLGFPITPQSTELQKKSAYQSVKVAISGLQRAGAIRQIVRGQTGQRAEFLLVYEHTGVTTAPRKRRPDHAEAPSPDRGMPMLTGVRSA